MDRMSQLLGGHRGQDAFVLSCALTAPWSMRIDDRASVSLVVMTRGACVLIPEAGPPERLSAGQLAVLRGPHPYVLADAVGRAPGVVVEPGQICRTLDPAMGIRRLGGRSWGNAADGPCQFLAATYELPGQVAGRVVEAMPERAVLPASAGHSALITALTAELVGDRPGHDVVVDRLVDIVLVSAVRSWFDRPEAEPPPWWTAQSDPVVGRVLALMHDRPGEPWTLETLAAEVGYSRAGLSRRFTAQLAQSPMTYLTGWRMAVAADRLSGSDATVESVGRAVGYANPFAFSTAFKRAHGRSPRAYRQAA